MAKPGFFRKKEFRLFLTVWIVYVFYLQMVGNSHMAINQSALAASIVNEGSFEIDKYYRAAAGGVSFYNGHYYSVQAPGISFISVPLYLAGKMIFNYLPDSLANHLLEKLDKYGETLPPDYLGNKKVPTDYFPDLSKKQVLEYLLISGFILPVFTTALFSAVTAVLLYSMLGFFTSRERLRVVITLFYAFGTLMFPLSTEYFERSIAIMFMFSAFIILFMVRHNKLKAKGSTVFAAGMLAGISSWFDYFHLFVAGLLFLYFLSFYTEFSILNRKRYGKFLKLRLDGHRISLLYKFLIGAIIAILPIFAYYYIIFDNPFTQSYAYTTIPESVHKISDITKISPPTGATIFHILAFLLFSPVILFAFYGLYRATIGNDKYKKDAKFIALFAILTFVYAFILSLIYPTTIAPSFKRYMTPILPFIFLFMPYIFPDNKFPKKALFKVLFIGVGVISIFLNWTSAQFGGHQGLGHFDPNTKKFEVLQQFVDNGPSSDFLRILAGSFSWDALILNIAGLLILAFILLLIWRPYILNKKAFRDKFAG